MELQSARSIVAGATGTVGAGLARALAAAGAEVALAGRNQGRLSALGEELDAPTARFDAHDAASCEGAVDALAAALGGVDLLAVAVGAPAFGDARELRGDTAAELMAVNALGPMALIGAGTRQMGEGDAVVALSATVADHPMAGLAAYSASKAALSAYLAALRRERRRDGLTVLDVRPPHMDTGFSGRALAGEPPDLPEPFEHERVVEAIVTALREGRRELSWDLRARELVTG